jgi:hypothetical protein
MAVTVTNVLAGKATFICNVKASADADTTATCPHGLAATPLLFGGNQLLSQGLTALSAWSWACDGTNLTGTKLASTGSGSGSNQVQGWAMLPHSIIE